jgi:hypothetical protein
MASGIIDGYVSEFIDSEREREKRDASSCPHAVTFGCVCVYCVVKLLLHDKERARWW